MTTTPQRDNTDDQVTWASMLRQHFVALDVSGAPADGFTGDVVSWSLGHLLLSQVQSLPQVIDRSGSLVRNDHRAYLQVGLVRSGRAVVEQDGREALLGPGDFVLYETTRPFTWTMDASPGASLWQLDVFTWPRRDIRLSESEAHQVTATTMTGDHGLSAIISRLLRDLMTEQPVLDLPRSAALADEIGDLLGVLTGGIVPDAARQPDLALVRRIERYIDEHLDDPDLDPRSIAAVHAVSLRQLHRLFAQRQQTVSRTIRSRRLERCRRDLVAPASASRSITEIARRRGFPDLGVFGRAFRETYGVSPRAYRSGSGPQPSVSEE